MSDYFDPNGGQSNLPSIMSEGGTSVTIQLAQAELNQAVTTARAFPRSYGKVIERINSLATLDAVTADECIYALPRAGKPIKGPSARFAEIVAASYGNCHSGSRIVAVDRAEKVVIAEGVFWDLETGAKITKQIQRRISDSKGKLFNDDMIAVTGNAASSIALREAILKGVPKSLWRGAYERAEQITLGKVETLVARRAKMISAFGGYGVTPDQIFASLEVKGLDDVGLDEVQTMLGVFAAIKAGEYTVESYFPAKVDPVAARQAAKGTATKQPQKLDTDTGELTDAKPSEEAQKSADQAKLDNAAANAQAAAARQAKANAEGKPIEDAQTVDPDPVQDDAPAQASLLPDDEVDYSTNSKLRGFVGDVAATGMDVALELWADDLERIKTDNPDLHSAMMQAATKEAAAK